MDTKRKMMDDAAARIRERTEQVLQELQDFQDRQIVEVFGPELERFEGEDAVRYTIH
ncbi:hypothetical protein [Ensifer aridi]|uniref:hypothetical protein n=1 Tax=Ensifer aridi TaxID=1708715 RepID=UPI0015E3D969|nr:hypothetical protein [Ensifer aridi]